MASVDVCRRLSGWLVEYPDPVRGSEVNAAARAEETALLAQWAGADELSRDEVEVLIDWRFRSMPHRAAVARMGVDGKRWSGDRRGGRPGVAELVRRALSADSEAEALSALCVSGGGVWAPGPALGSAVLAACRPERYAVADAKALRALRALGLLPVGSRSFRETDGPGYLVACRRLAGECSLSLLDVWRALSVAGGPGGLHDPYVGTGGRVWGFAGRVVHGGQRVEGFMVHRPGCQYCNDGLGLHVRLREKKRGSWHPFDSVASAEEWAIERGYRVVRRCARCKPA